MNLKDPIFNNDNIKCKEIWYKDGKRHRDDRDPETRLNLPAIIEVDGTQEWYIERVRIDPPVIKAS